MANRRQFIAWAGAVLATTPRARAGATRGAGPLSAHDTAMTARYLMPDEGDPHQRTWMAFGASEAVWGTRLLPEVQRNLAAIATAIGKHEPVSMLVRERDRDAAEDLVDSDTVTMIDAALDDLWMRDTGPVFVRTIEGHKAAIDFNFNGWGRKQAHGRDADVAQLVIELAHAEGLETDLVLEGGALEVDGTGTAIITESCVLNSNRNPAVSKMACERELERLMGLTKIIWLPGVKGKDITDGHTDFYARFAAPGVVVAGLDPDPKSFDHDVTKAHLEILRRSTTADGRPLQVVVIEGPASVRDTYASDDFAAGYINFYVCNGAVIAPEFGDARADRAAKATLERLYPGRQVVQLNIDGIAAGGGGIHCTTQQEPAA